MSCHPNLDLDGGRGAGGGRGRGTGGGSLSRKRNPTPGLLVVSSDKSQCFDSVVPLDVIYDSPFLHPVSQKGLSKQQFMAGTRPGQPSSKIGSGMRH